MATDYKIAIVGSGPAGLSAAARAATLNQSHILLERADHPCDTIFKYQKSKHVMAAPEILPLRCDLPFAAQSREAVLQAFEGGMTAAGVNLRRNTEVTAIGGARGDFTLSLADGGRITAEFVVLAVGLQGNLKKLAIPGADLPFVQYHLDDPAAHQAEEIVVIGAGDAGIENALALAADNFVSLVNTSDDFPRARPANVALIRDAIKLGLDDGGIAHITRVEPREIKPGELVVRASDGRLMSLPCERLLVRIGAQPPRAFLEACGIAFTSPDRNAVPEVANTCETAIPGLYMVGALTGHPLIKQCLNQGYEAVEHILGKAIAPSDEPLLRAKLRHASVEMSPDELVDAIRELLPLYASLTKLQIREFLLHANIRRFAVGDVVCRRDDYADTLYSVLDGEVGLHPHLDRPDEALVRLGRGQFFGELALIEGRRRTRTVIATAPSLLLEVDRNTIIRLQRSHPSIKEQIDRPAVLRHIREYLAPHASDETLAPVVATATIREYKADEVLIEEGERDNWVYLIRRGSVMVSQRVAGRDIVTAFVPAGNYVGEMSVATGQRRAATVRATVKTEAIRIDGAAFQALLADPEVNRQINEKIETRVVANQQLRAHPDQGDVIRFLMQNGIGEATDFLLIDEALCVRCDNCEKACAETHFGISRLQRDVGPTFGTLHLPIACRHCEDAHCMADCPTDAIHREANGEVSIDSALCIGCYNCERNCPYGVISMVEPPPERKSSRLLTRLLFGGRGGGHRNDAPPAPLPFEADRRSGAAAGSLVDLAERASEFGGGSGAHGKSPGSHDHGGRERAFKCDLCRGIDGGPACVRACPTGAAIRVKPAQFIEVMRREPA